MQSLAYNPPKSDKETVESVPSIESGPQYPSLRFSGEQADKAGLDECEFGEVYEIKLKVKVTSINGGLNYPGSGNSKDKPAVEFDVLACDPPEESGESVEEENEEEAEEPKRKAKQRVVSPKDMGLED